MITVVTTTIHGTSFIKEYLKNVRKYKHSNVKFIVVGDNKTPDEWNLFEDSQVEYWSPVKQKKYLKEYNILNYKDLIPDNDARRRNFGFLRSLELDAEYMISIDDDNLPGKQDFIGEHLESFNSKIPEVSSINRIVNPIRVLHMNHYTYSRGYPINYSFLDSFEITLDNKRKNVLNLGLWTEKPDVDAIYNLMYEDLRSKGINIRHLKIAYNNYFPINTQNVCISKELIPLFHNVYMDKSLGVHRFDDIWIGLFLLKLIHANNHSASFGLPLTIHRRNVHNYIRDLQTEFIGFTINSRIWDLIMNYELKNKDYINGYLEIAELLKSTKIFTFDQINNFINKIGECMLRWIEIGEKVK